MGTWGRRFCRAFSTKPSVFSEIVLYHELLCEVTLQESTSNHDDRNRNEKTKEIYEKWVKYAK